MLVTGRYIEEKYIRMDEEESYRATRDLIRKEMADGVFYYCDDLAVGGLSAKGESGSTIRIIGYDDIQAAGYLGLSTVRQDANILGRSGARKIVELIKRRTPIDEAEPISECLQLYGTSARA